MQSNSLSLINLEDVSRLPFNNFKHFLNHYNFDVDFFSGVQDVDSLIGGNCIFKSRLAAEILEQTYSKVSCVVEIGGFHHAIIASDENLGMVFYDSCLYMPHALGLKSDFECMPTMFADMYGDVNFVAVDLGGPLSTQVVWKYSSLGVSRSFTFNYDLLETNQISFNDFEVEPFKTVPKALIFRYLTVNNQLMHLSFFVQDKVCVLSRAFSRDFVFVSQLSVDQKSQFIQDVGLDVLVLEGLMHKACEFMLLSKRDV